MRPHLHTQNRTKTLHDSDPLAAAFRTIEINALRAANELERATATATGKVREFLAAAKDVHILSASAAKDAAHAVEQAELLVSHRAQ